MSLAPLVAGSDGIKSADDGAQGIDHEQVQVTA